MIAVITGDIIQSRKAKNPALWLEPLNQVLENKSVSTYQVFRGDSFQAEIKHPEKALTIAFLIKATLKSMKPLDVRMSIGIGRAEHQRKALAESTGEAYINSGHTFDQLASLKQNLAVKSPWEDFDTDLNLNLKLALVLMEHWTPTAAAHFIYQLQHPDLTQQQMAAELNIAQSSVSDRQKRAHVHELMELLDAFERKLKQQLKGN